jgi:hypothetical protein
MCAIDVNTSRLPEEIAHSLVAKWAYTHHHHLSTSPIEQSQIKLTAVYFGSALV